MTKQQALKAAQARFGKRAMIQARPNAALIGAHGEYVTWAQVRTINEQMQPVTWHGKATPAVQLYRCDRCEQRELTPDGLIVRQVWHKPGGPQTEYAVGHIDSFLGAFHIRGTGDSFEAALRDAETR